MKKMFSLRRSAMVWTDKRAKLIQELLGGESAPHAMRYRR